MWDQMTLKYTTNDGPYRGSSNEELIKAIGEHVRNGHWEPVSMTTLHNGALLVLYKRPHVPDAPIATEEEIGPGVTAGYL